MKRQPVTSSNIVSVGHDPEKDELHVEFRGGNVYIYSGVDADKHAAMMKADSVGGFFHANIKGGGYKFTKG